MARKGVNKVVLLGHLGADPETRYSAAGAPIVSIRIATSESWRDKQTGELQERTEWHRIKFFGKLAEIAGEYLRKGSQVYVEGSLRTEKYKAQDGSDRYSTDVIGDEMQMLGSRSDRGGDSAQEQASQSRASAPAPQHQAPAAAPAPAPAPAPAHAGGDWDDGLGADLPF